MARPTPFLPLLALATALVAVPTRDASAMCAGNVFATCKPRTATVRPASATKPTAPARRRTVRKPPTLRR